MDRKKYRRQAQVLKSKKLRTKKKISMTPEVRQGVVKIEPIPKSISLPRHAKIFTGSPAKKQKPNKGCSGCKRQK